MNIKFIIDFNLEDYSVLTSNDILKNIIDDDVFLNISKYYKYTNYKRMEKNAVGFSTFLKEVLNDDKNLLQSQKVLGVLAALYFDGNLIITDTGSFYVMKDNELYLPVLSHTDISFSKVYFKDIHNDLLIKRTIPYKFLYLYSLSTSMGFKPFEISDISVFKDLITRRIHMVDMYSNEYIKQIMGLISDEDESDKELKKLLQKLKRDFSYASMGDAMDSEEGLAYVFLSMVIFESNLMHIKKLYLDFIGDSDEKLNDIYRIILVNFYTTNSEMYNKTDFLIDIKNRLEARLQDGYKLGMDTISGLEFVKDLRYDFKLKKSIDIFLDVLDELDAKEVVLFLVYTLGKISERINDQIVIKNIADRILVLDNFSHANKILAGNGSTDFIDYYLGSLFKDTSYTGFYDESAYNEMVTKYSAPNKSDKFYSLLKVISDELSIFMRGDDVVLLIKDCIDVYYQLCTERDVINIILDYTTETSIKIYVLGILSIIFNASIYFTDIIEVRITNIYDDLSEAIKVYDLLDAPTEKKYQLQKLLYNKYFIIDNEGRFNLLLYPILEYNFHVLNYTLK